MAPIVHGLEDKYKSQMNFVYLDVDDENTQVFQETLQFYYQPHVFLLDAEGNIIQQWIGYVQQAELEAALVSALE
jgi:thioredoxin-related protein